MTPADLCHQLDEAREARGPSWRQRTDSEERIAQRVAELLQE